MIAMRKTVLWLATALGLAMASPASAQSNCQYIATGAVLTAGQWNACFAAKQNALGYTPVNKAGDTMLGRLTAAVSTTISAGFNLPQGFAPTSPNNGDLWTTSSGLYVRINGSTIGPLIGGAGVSLVVGTTPITSGATTRILYDNAGVLGEYTISGSGTAVAMATGPTISGLTVTGSFTATGLVTNGALVNPSTTVNGQTCTLGSTCTVTASATTITVGSTTIASGTTTRILYNNAGTLGEYTISGSGTVVAMANSPSFTTPALGVATATSVAIGGCTIGSNLLCVDGAVRINTASSTALSVGPTPNPAFIVNAAAGAGVTGIQIGGAAAGGGANLSVISSGTNEGLTLDAKGSGTISIGSVSTGAITLARATTISAALTYGGVTLSNSVTGTGSMVLSAAPTLTGTTTIATLALTTVGAHTISGAITYGGVTLSNSVTGTGPMVLGTSPSISGLTVTGSFTATGLVTNASLANPSTTVNGQTCVLGSTCTVTASATAITVGTTTVGSGTTTRVLYNNAGTLGEYTISGSGTVVAMATGPSFTTPALGVATGTSLALNGCTIGSNAFCATGTAAISSTLTSAAITVTSSSATAFAVGPSGSTNPSLLVDASTGSAATGLKVKSAAAGGGLALSVITSGTNENLTIDAAGAGTISIGATSTGAITLTRATTLSAALTYGGVTLSNAVTGTGPMVLGTAPSIAGGTHTAITSLGIRSTGSGAFDMTIANTENLTAGRTLTVTLNDAARTINLAGNLTLAAAFATSGANSLTLTTSGATNVTLPTSGTLVNSAVTTLSSLVSIGTISTGVWQGTKVGLAYGGTNADLSATGGANQFVKQTSVGGAFTVATILAADLPLGSSSAFGAVKCDGTTITCTAGVITAVGAAATAITVGTTAVGSGTTTRILYNNAGVLGEYTISGSGTAVAMATSPSISGLTVTGSFTATGLVGNASLSDMNNSTTKCRTTAGSGVPEDCTAAQTAAIIGTVGGTLKSKVVNTTYNLTTATGTQAITGVGFTPTSCLAVASTNSITSYNSFGFADSARVAAGSFTTNAILQAQNGSFLILADATSTSYQVATIQSYDADGLTLSWTKVGAPTGTAGIEILCFR